MDETEKRVSDTIQQMDDKDLYSIGDAQVASDEARKKARVLQQEYAKGEFDNDNNHTEKEEQE